MTITTTAAYLSDLSISYGVEGDTPEAMQGMDPWTLTLTTEHGSESFPFFKGKGHNGAEPEVAELIHCCVMDASMLECEPELIDETTAAAIETNSAKMARLFGTYWQTLQRMEEDEIFAVF